MQVSHRHPRPNLNDFSVAMRMKMSTLSPKLSADVPIFLFLVPDKSYPNEMSITVQSLFGMLSLISTSTIHTEVN